MSEEAISEQPAGPQGHGAIRFVFEYDGTDVRLVSRRHVDMIAPTSDILDGVEDRQGFWAEVRGADGATLYRQVMHNPVRTDAEVFSDDPEQSVGRIQVDRPTGVFTVLVPDAVEADHLALISNAPRTAQLRAEATEVIRVPMRSDEGGMS